MARQYVRYVATLILVLLAALAGGISRIPRVAAASPVDSGVQCTELDVHPTVFMHPLSTASATGTSSDVTKPGPAPYTLGAIATLDPTQRATITGFRFSFGDSSLPALVATNQPSAIVDHTYAAPATYAAEVTVLATSGSGQPEYVSSPACHVTVSLPTPTYCRPGIVAGAPTCDSTGCSLRPLHSTVCRPSSSQPLAAITASGPTTGATPMPPTHLVNAGAGNIAAVFVGAALATAAAFRLYFWYSVNHRKVGG